MTRRKNNNPRGVALIVVLLSLALLAAVAMGITTLSSGHLMQAHSEAQSLEAMYAAQAGAWIKLGQIRSTLYTNDISGVLSATGATYDVSVTVPGSDPFPPAGTFYVESTGTSAGGHMRRVSVLMALTESRWSHAAFGNNKVIMRSGSYTDSFHSGGGAVDHSRATIATNNASGGLELEKKDVVVGWANSTDMLTGKKKKKKDDSDKFPVPEADVVGPPGSIKGSVVTGGAEAGKNYSKFATASQRANMSPVSLPVGLPLGTGGAPDPLALPYHSVTGSAGPDGASVKPGEYHDLTAGSGEVVSLDVSDPGLAGTTVQYIFHSVQLAGGQLKVKQPALGAPVTVEVYLDTGSAATGGVDPTAGVKMDGAALINDKSVPLLLQFLIAGEGANTLEGHDEAKDGFTPTAYYVVYAPEGSVEVTRGQIYGSVVANEVLLDGESLDPKKAPAVIHFDMALLDDTGNPPMINILSVQRH